MKVCKIVDEYRDSLVLGYLLCFKRGNTFSIEISDDMTPFEAPVFFESFIKKGQRTIDPVWSERWVRSRIVPEDRQNLGSVLKDNGLKEYDAYKLLMLGHGRCAQDDCAVIPIDISEAPDWLHERRKHKLDYAVLTEGRDIIAMFRDDTMRKIDPVQAGLATGKLEMICGRDDLLQQMEMIPGGLGVRWQSDIVLTAEQLYGKGVELGVTGGELRRLIKYYVMLTPDACSALDCSRQYIDKKVKDGSLQTLKESGNGRLYTAGEIARLIE